VNWLSNQAYHASNAPSSHRAINSYAPIPLPLDILDSCKQTFSAFVNGHWRTEDNGSDPSKKWFNAYSLLFFLPNNLGYNKSTNEPCFPADGITAEQMRGMLDTLAWLFWYMISAEDTYHDNGPDAALRLIDDTPLIQHIHQLTHVHCSRLFGNNRMHGSTWPTSADRQQAIAQSILQDVNQLLQLFHRFSSCIRTAKLVRPIIAYDRRQRREVLIINAHLADHQYVHSARQRSAKTIHSELQSWSSMMAQKYCNLNVDSLPSVKRAFIGPPSVARNPTNRTRDTEKNDKKSKSTKQRDSDKTHDSTKGANRPLLKWKSPRPDSSSINDLLKELPQNVSKPKYPDANGSNICLAYATAGVRCRNSSGPRKCRFIHIDCGTADINKEKLAILQQVLDTAPVSAHLEWTDDAKTILGLQA